MPKPTGQRKQANPDAPDAEVTEEHLRQTVDFLRVFGAAGLQALQQTMEAMKAPKNTEARRELVLTMVLAKVQTYKIRACIEAAHPGTGDRTIDTDIAWAKEWHADKVDDRRRQEIKQDVDGIYQSIISRGLATGNLSAARASNDGRARLHHLIEEMPGGGSTPDTDEDFRISLDRKLSRLAAEGTKG